MYDEMSIVVDEEAAVGVTVQPSRIDKRTKTADNIPWTAMDSEWEFPNMLPKTF